MRIAPDWFWRKRGVGAGKSELLTGKALLEDLKVAGCVVTADALHCQREVCETIIEKEGDYLIKVKGNQPRLFADIVMLFEDPLTAVQRIVEECRHGDRQEVRTLEVSSDLAAYSDWPGLAQVCRIERVVTTKRGRTREERYAVTSLRAERADPARLLELHRGQWGIENRVHYVRDVSFGEDASQIRSGSAPQVLAALRNTALNLLRLAGATNIAAALRRNAARPQEALALLGISVAPNYPILYLKDPTRGRSPLRCPPLSQKESSHQ
jgi:predicted transposase YbfD/YdcC